MSGPGCIGGDQAESEPCNATGRRQEPRHLRRRHGRDRRRHSDANTPEQRVHLHPIAEYAEADCLVDDPSGNDDRQCGGKRQPRPQTPRTVWRTQMRGSPARTPKRQNNGATRASTGASKRVETVGWCELSGSTAISFFRKSGISSNDGEVFFARRSGGARMFLVGFNGLDVIVGREPGINSRRRLSRHFDLTQRNAQRCAAKPAIH